MAGRTVAPGVITRHTVVERLAPPYRATAAMTLPQTAGPPGTAAGRAGSVPPAEADGARDALPAAVVADRAFLTALGNRAAGAGG
ncbi:hypothetical protein ABZ642_20515 [Streptomyces sp. NPDC007157]|uniref:hypothetical protein n=1 Tax=Streptomyces sp. NPDC007157 TaxID=3154681 RepID=UPI0033EE2785